MQPPSFVGGLKYFSFQPRKAFSFADALGNHETANKTAPQSGTLLASTISLVEAPGNSQQ
jgi:hypothetical protein